VWLTILIQVNSNIVLSKRKEPKVKENLYCDVVESLEMIESLGFTKVSNEKWTLNICESDYFRKHLLISKNYLYLVESSKIGDNKGNEVVQDIVLLWNGDVAGKISMTNLGMYINLLVLGNEFETKEESS